MGTPMIQGAIALIMTSMSWWNPAKLDHYTSYSLAYISQVIYTHTISENPIASVSDMDVFSLANNGTFTLETNR